MDNFLLRIYIFQIPPFPLPLPRKKIKIWLFFNVNFSFVYLPRNIGLVLFSSYFSTQQKYDLFHWFFSQKIKTIKILWNFSWTFFHGVFYMLRNNLWSYCALVDIQILNQKTNKLHVSKSNIERGDSCGSWKNKIFQYCYIFP